MWGSVSSIHTIMGGLYDEWSMAKHFRLSLGVAASSIKIEKMAGKAAIAWRFVTDAACLVSVPSSVSLLAGGNVYLPLGTWQLAEALTRLGEALTGPYCCITQYNTGTVSSFHPP